MKRIIMTKLISLILWLGSGFGLTIYAQETASSIRIKTNDEARDEKPSRPIVATEVQLLVKVRDAFGEIVPNLQASDFSVYDNGRRQINVECKPYRAPLQLILLIDETCRWSDREASLNLELQKFSRSLSAEDRIAVMQFSGSFALMHDWVAPASLPSSLFQPAGLRTKQVALYDSLLFAITKFDDAEYNVEVPSHGVVMLRLGRCGWRHDESCELKQFG